MKERGSPELDDWEIVFCNHYLDTWNQTEAYVRAKPEVNRRHARNLATQLMANPNIKSYIEERIKDHELATGISKIWLLRKMKSIVNADYSKLADDWGQLKDFEELKLTNTEMFAAVESVSDTKYGRQVKLRDPVRAAERICKMLGYDMPEEKKITVEPVNLDNYTDEEIAVILKLARESDESTD